MDETQTRRLLSRRSALKQGVSVAVGVAWVAPAVQIVSMQSAAAASAPPEQVLGTKTGRSGGTEVLGTKLSALPRTGTDLPVAGLTVAGTAAVAAGAGAIVVSRHLRKDVEPGAHRPGSVDDQV